MRSVLRRARTLYHFARSALFRRPANSMSVQVACRRWPGAIDCQAGFPDQKAFFEGPSTRGGVRAAVQLAEIFTGNFLWHAPSGVGGDRLRVSASTCRPSEASRAFSTSEYSTRHPRCADWHGRTRGHFLSADIGASMANKEKTSESSCKPLRSRPGPTMKPGAQCNPAGVSALIVPSSFRKAAPC